MIFYAIVLLALGGLAWIRLAPSDPAVWHVDPQVTTDQDLAGGVRRRIPGDAARLQALHDIITDTPRTSVLAGSPSEGHVTYVTRSKWMGFPDYTTVRLDEGQIEIYGRLRFGQSDMGTNRSRVDGWIAALPGEGSEGTS